jgi:putative toxin-antitoxin system antitoxin component (TIGR02293 family)
MSTNPFGRIEKLAEQTMLRRPAGFELPAETITEMVSHGVMEEEIRQIVAAPAELAGRMQLTPEQSDRAARLAHVISFAERVFGSRDKAFFWLRLPSEQLEGRTPISYLSTETGARFVEEMLVRIDHGIAA